MSRTLIVARMKQSDTDAVKDIWTESDAGDLPHMLGVVERRLYRFHDLYFHEVDTDTDLQRPLSEMRDHPLFVDINRKLMPYIAAYDPETWRGPRDAMAEQFYQWNPNS